jgi:2-keto-4-pentenoate hydratase/2-oxohepta-3-ene-1,7-dioic acid hydratase in catechol pathway
MREGTMNKFVIVGLLLTAGLAHAAVPLSTPDTAFKLATYDTGGQPMVGMVIGDHVIEISGANADLTRAENLPTVDIPNEMRALIERYADTKERLYQIANYYADDGLSERPFVHSLDEIHVQAPIKYPYNLLAVAANYQDHAAEMSRKYGNFNPEPVDPDRSNPVLFAKSPRSTIIDPGSPYPIPPTTKVFDYENELAIVIGKPAMRVTLENAGEYIFGYTIMFDVSSRDNPNEPEEDEQGGFDFGVNWFEAKSRDNSAPMGPFITPREFIGDPANLRIVTRVNGVTKQDGNSKDMIHNEAYLLRHATSILTLYPGDILASGTPAGVGSAKNPPEFLSPGDKVEMTIEGIGTIVTPIE